MKVILQLALIGSTPAMSRGFASCVDLRASLHPRVEGQPVPRTSRTRDS